MTVLDLLADVLGPDGSPVNLAALEFPKDFHTVGGVFLDLAGGAAAAASSASSSATAASTMVLSAGAI